MNKVKVEKKGIGFGTLLQIILIVLKFCNVITWSWGLVLLPLWISLGLGLLLLILTLIVIFKS